MKISYFVTLMALAMASLSAIADDPVCERGCSIPEPGSLALLGVGAAVGLALWARDRKNKK